MPKLKSLIQTVCAGLALLHIKISKKMYRNCAILCAGGAAVAVLSFSSSGFSGSGKNAAFAYTAQEAGDMQTEDELEKEQVQAEVNENLGVELLSNSLIKEEQIIGDLYVLQTVTDDSPNEGQRFVAEKLVSDIEVQQEEARKEQEEAEKIREEIAVYQEQKEQQDSQADWLEATRSLFGMESFTEADYNNLLRIVEAEAGINDVEGKMMVANVVLNRVMSTRFPDTVSEVIFAPGQFSPVSNGRFYSVRVKDSTVEAVNRALGGEDNSQGALFFMNRGASRAGAVSWFDSSLTYLFSHGGHEYFK